MTRLPCADSISSRSAMSLTTIAVLLMASAAESASAVCQPMPHRLGAQWANIKENPVASSMVSTT